MAGVNSTSGSGEYGAIVGKLKAAEQQYDALSGRPRTPAIRSALNSLLRQITALQNQAQSTQATTEAASRRLRSHPSFTDHIR